MKARYKFRKGNILKCSYDNFLLHIDDDDVVWRTTENGNKIGINAENGDVVGNSHMVQAIKEGIARTKTYNDDFQKAYKRGDYEICTHLLEKAPKGSVVKANGVIYTRQQNGKWVGRFGRSLDIYDGIDGLKFEKVAGWGKPKCLDVEKNTSTVKADEHQSADEYFKGKSILEDKADILAKNLQEHGGIKVSQQEAVAMLNALYDYSLSSYTDLWSYEHCGVVPEGSNVKELYENINKFIDLSPKAEGTLYRGCSMTMDKIKGIAIGDTISMDGVTSFSTDKGVAHNFTDPPAGKIPVVFKTDEGVHRATSITPFSHFQGRLSEKEVLMHADAKHTVTNITKENYEGEEILTIHIREIE